VGVPLAKRQRTQQNACVSLPVYDGMYVRTRPRKARLCGSAYVLSFFFFFRIERLFFFFLTLFSKRCAVIELVLDK
jgi:hypothetical protein